MRHTLVTLLTGLSLLLAGGCSHGHAGTAIARAEFHERWNAREFRKIYAASAIGEKPGSREDSYLRAWIEARRDFGAFESDASDGPISENQISYGGYEIVAQTFNSRYSVFPVVESFQWQIKDDQVRLLSYTASPNAEMRCERHLLGSDCHLVQVGPVPATPPVTDAELRAAR